MSVLRLHYSKNSFLTLRMNERSSFVISFFYATTSRNRTVVILIGNCITYFVMHNTVMRTLLKGPPILYENSNPPTVFFQGVKSLYQRMRIVFCQPESTLISLYMYYKTGSETLKINHQMIFTWQF